MTQALKENGINSRQVSIRSGHSSLEVTVRDPNIDFTRVEEIVRGFEKIYRDDFSYEILSGGNTFVFVRLSDHVGKVYASHYIDYVRRASREIGRSFQTPDGMEIYMTQGLNPWEFSLHAKWGEDWHTENASVQLQNLDNWSEDSVHDASMYLYKAILETRRKGK